MDHADQVYRDLLEHADDMVYLHAPDGRIIFVNPAAERLTGYSRAELLEANTRSIFVPDYQREADEVLGTASRAPSSRIKETDISTRDGHLRPVEVSMRAVYKNGELLVQGIARDISRRRNLERQLEHMASRDYLTGLLNRRRFEEELQLQLAHARRTGVSSALLFLDLDHFKDVNDTFGHSVGDELLVGIASILRERLAQTNAAARLGGDEFAMILPRMATEEARAVAEQVLNWLRASPFVLAGHGLSISGSIGVALIAPDGMITAEELLSRADVAMYQAKESGRNCVCIYSPDMDWRARIESGLAWRQRISEALERDQLLLHAQPILDVRKNRITHYEMLVRIPDERGGTVSASVFMESAERFGFVHAIDRWTVRRTIDLLAEFERRGRDVALDVNVSGAGLGDEELLPIIRDELAARSVDPGRLVVEVTETVAIADLARAQRFVAGLKRLGCRFALDDFGVGFSSFYQLKHLDVDYLKIDGSFIRELPRDPVDQHLVRAMVEVARALGKETIAEFVTDAETVELLGELGVDYAQGYHVGRPGDVQDVLRDKPGEAGRAA